MYISKLKIKNFKCFEIVEFNFDPNFNLIIGENNSGKSTIFEAFRLWQIAFNKFLKDRTNNESKSSFYSREYFSVTIEELSFLRIEKFENLFFPQSKTIEICLTLQNQELFAELPILFTLNSEGQNLRFNLCLLKSHRPLVSDYLLKVIEKSKGSSFKDMLLMSYISPVFHIPTKEPKFFRGYILDKLHQSKANEVIRNLIEDYAPIDYQTSKNKNPKKRSVELFEIEKTLHEILTNSELLNGEEPCLNFTSNLRGEEDVNISLFAKNNLNNTKVELSQLGSGTLNILNILSVLSYGDYERFHLTVLLLDEPDSHLHSNHQRKLYQDLIKKSQHKNKQIFVITHNHELIDSSEKVLFIDNEIIKQNNRIELISKELYYKIYKKIAVEYHEKMLEIANKKQIEIELKNLKTPTLYCEGTTDVLILKAAYRSIYDKEFFNGEIEIYGGGGASKVANVLIYNSNTEICIIGLFDKDKEGRDHFERLRKNGHNFELSQVNSFSAMKKETNVHALVLPTPVFRNSKWFEDNLTIEYLFSDSTLINSGVEMIIEDYMTIRTIKSMTGKDFKKDSDIEKQKLLSNINNLKKDDFLGFIPLFEEISRITKLPL